jgi:2'-5' RNA ligase
VKRGAKARLFVAVDPPAAIQNDLARWARSAVAGRESIRRLDAGLLHVTLCFLGYRPLSELDAIARMTLEHAAALSELEVGAPLWLPPRSPRVLAVELRDPGGALESLQRTLAGAFAAEIGYVPEKRRFRPHLTVARMRAGVAPEARELPATPRLRFIPQALTLYRSRLYRSGAEYEPVARAEL